MTRPPSCGLDRREVLRSLGLLALAGGAGALRFPRVASTDPGVGAAGGGRALDAARWRTAAAFAEALLPSEPGLPGAREVNAVGHVDATLADPDFARADARRVLAGLSRLDAIARARHGRAFADLDADARDAVVAALAAEPEGPRTIEAALGLVLEAAFGDPVYGVNPDGIGWAWIGHEPALPRPKAPWRAGKRG